MSGKKFDSDKVPLDLIPSEALFEIGRVLQAGAKKYERANWTKGIEMSRLISAAMRHILQFNDGQDKDIECDTNHLANAAVNLMFGIWMYKNRPDLDDRWAVKKEEPFVKGSNELISQMGIYAKLRDDTLNKPIQAENMKELYSHTFTTETKIEDNSPYAKVARGIAKFNKEKT